MYLPACRGEREGNRRLREYVFPIATISPISTPFELKVGRPGGPNHKIIGEVLVTPVTVHVSWKWEPSVKSPHDVMLVDELLAKHRRVCVCANVCRVVM
jgi:hypothetical protein